MPHATAVSVVIPCYNGAEFVIDAIDSVRAQTHQAAEIIVVDDGSTDASADLVTRTFPDIGIIRQSRRGLSAARNAGLMAAIGEAIVFLDADDRLLPHALATGVRALADHPGCAFVYGRYHAIDRNGKRISPTLGRDVHAQHHLAMLRSNFIGMHAAVMYQRAVFGRTGGFDIRLPRCEDYDMYLRLLREHPAFGHGETVAEYRQHGSNMSHDDAAMLRTVLTVLRSQPDRDASPEVRAARRDGKRQWKQYYAARLGRSMRRQIHERDWAGAARAACHLARHDPATLGGIVTDVTRSAALLVMKAATPRTFR